MLKTNPSEYVFNGFWCDLGILFGAESINKVVAKHVRKRLETSRSNEDETKKADEHRDGSKGFACPAKAKALLATRFNTAADGPKGLGAGFCPQSGITAPGPLGKHAPRNC